VQLLRRHQQQQDHGDLHLVQPVHQQQAEPLSVELDAGLRDECQSQLSPLGRASQSRSRPTAPLASGPGTVPAAIAAIEQCRRSCTSSSRPPQQVDQRRTCMLGIAPPLTAAGGAAAAPASSSVWRQLLTQELARPLEQCCCCPCCWLAAAPAVAAGGPGDLASCQWQHRRLSSRNACMARAWVAWMSCQLPTPWMRWVEALLELVEKAGAAL